jgi:1-acyl-sn-glycerol-3-phosphate acyltransferase
MQLVDAITSFVARKGGLDPAAVRQPVERAIQDLGEHSVGALQDRLAAPSSEYTFYAPDPLARRVHHVLASIVLRERLTVAGAEHLDAVRGRPAIIVANHLSYSDANLIELLLLQAGGDEIASRLAVVAGPKVYSDVTRRFSSLCFGTIKTPQNEGVSTGQTVMNARDVAAAARQTIEAAEQRLQHGDVVLLFPEGTRSRAAQMQPFLPGVSRYFQRDDLWILPIGISGTEHLFAIGEATIASAKIAMTIGRPMTVESIRAVTGSDRRAFVDRLGSEVAALLPMPYRGAYAVGADLATAN